MPSNSILNIKKDGEWIEIPALKGEDGFSPTATVEKVGKVATITITDINGTTTATIADGTSSGGSGEENTIESISVNGTPISIDENKNVDITVPKVTNDLTDELKSSYDDAVTAKHTHDNKTVLDGITAEKIESWNKAEENIQSDWNETDDTADGFIKNKPAIPDITGLATETYVDNKVADYTKTVDLADVATSGSYNDLADKPTIPSLDGYAKTSEIPSKVSELENDSNYLSSIPEEYVTETELEAKGYLTEHQDISGKVDKVEGKSLISDTEIARLATVNNYDDTDIKAEIAKKANTTAIPSKVSELTNDSNYQTAEQVNSTVTTEIAKVVADAPESLNTLKEMSDWIVGHEDDASAMNSAISDNKTAITALQTGKADKSEIPTTVAELTDSDDYAKKTDLHSHDNKTVLDGITSTKVSDWDSAKTHADSAHAPSNAQENVLETVKVNGTALIPSNKAVNVTVPTTVSELTDSSSYAKKTDIPTTLPANGGNSDTVNGHTVNSDVPENAKFTDTTYSDATQMEHGLMSVDDKKKLDGLKKYTPDGTTITADEDGTLHGVAEVAVDTALSTTSTNPVQNKVVTSNLTDIRKETTVNLLKPTLQTTTQNGITCTNNGDGTYTLNGTATAFTFFYLLETVENGFSGMKYVGAPDGSGWDSYFLWGMYRDNDKNEVKDITSYKYSNGVVIEDCETYPYLDLRIAIREGQSLNNLNFKPMLTTNLSATYDDYVPYTGDTGRLNGDVAELKAQSVKKDNVVNNQTTTEEGYALDARQANPNVGGSLGSQIKAVRKETTVNLLKPTLRTNTDYSITCTNNGDGTYTLNGTPPTGSGYYIFYLLQGIQKNIYGGCLFTGTPFPADEYRLHVVYYDNNDTWKAEKFVGSEGIVIDGSYPRIAFNIICNNGASPANNLIFKPMLTTNLSATYDDFVPYTGDGETLASDVAEIKKNLGGLTFSARGTTLSITDGKKTWTLEANS